MHPLIQRFLDSAAALDALARPGDDDARALATAIDLDKGLRKQLESAKGRSLSGELEQRLIVASTRAASARLAADPSLGPKVRAAIDAVVQSGGTKEEGEALVQQAVLDEAFGWAEDPTGFDAAFLAETLDGLVPLASVDTERVEGWVDEFVKQVEGPKRPLRLAVAEALLEAAWSDGPQPIGAEHVDDAVDALAQSVASKELELAGSTLVEFLTFLSGKGLLGPLRQSRLTDVAKAAALAPAMGDDEEDEAEEDGSDEEE